MVKTEFVTQITHSYTSKTVNNIVWKWGQNALQYFTSMHRNVEGYMHKLEETGEHN